MIDKIKLKQKYITPRNPYELALEFNLERLYKFLAEYKQQDRLTHICIESRDQKSNQRIEESFKNIKSGKNWFNKCFPFEIKFTDKRTNSTGLQLADLVAEPIRSQHLRPHKINPNFMSLKHKFYCKGGRDFTGSNFKGYGLKVFP